MSTRCNVEFYDGDEVKAEFGEPAARIYQHGNGYPAGIIPQLRFLEKILKANIPSYGPRLNDPEWAAAEFVSQFRVISNAAKNPGSDWQYEGEGNFGPGNKMYRHRGGIYVSQQIHQDIKYLYRVICRSDGWEVRIFLLKQGPGSGFISFEEITEKYNSKTGKEIKEAQ